MRDKLINLSCALALAAVTFPSPSSASVVFADGDFQPVDWTLTQCSWGSGATVTFTRQTAGGNPDAFLSIRTTLHQGGSAIGVVGFFRCAWATYDPSTQGAIDALFYEEDAKRITGVYDVQGTGPCLWQDGKLFVYWGLVVGTQTQWHHLATDGLAANDFGLAEGTYCYNASQHPDFGPTGGVISFGFARNVSTQGGTAYDHTAGIDNWHITIVNAGPVAPADLEIVKTGPLSPVSLGDTLLYQVTVVNHGAIAATGVAVQDVLPLGTQLLTAVPSQGVCSDSVGLLTCDLGEISSGGSATIALALLLQQVVLRNSAIVRAEQPDPDASNNVSSQDSEIACDLASAAPTSPPDQGFRAYASPNPTRDRTAIRFSLPSPARVTVSIFDVSGREVKAFTLTDFSAGPHVVDWDGRDAMGNAAPAGIYFYRVAGNEDVVAERKFVVLR
jgi:uncharacterized repeat protein (TIGR01451 family)